MASDPVELFTTAVGFIEAAVPYDIFSECFHLPCAAHLGILGIGSIWSLSE